MEMVVRDSSLSLSYAYRSQRLLVTERTFPLVGDSAEKREEEGGEGKRWSHGHSRLLADRASAISRVA